ncbi:MAG TPA: hypothetical protein VF662_12180 [Allosphingosinicella sp.]|jgi:hypothetical protein
MHKPLFAFLTLAALPAAALAQTPASGEWTVSGSAQGCIAHTTLPHGTVLSLLAGPGQDSLLFLMQNKGWSSLQEGSRHKVAVQLDGRSPWQFDAVARTELDSDGPGLLFTVAPGEAEGAKFINELAGADGLNVGQNGKQLEGARLSGGGSAITRLAQCMSRMWGGTGSAPEAVAASSGGVPL